MRTLDLIRKRNRERQQQAQAEIRKEIQESRKKAEIKTKQGYSSCYKKRVQ